MPTMTDAAIWQEIDTDPLAVGYAALGDVDAAAVLNSLTGHGAGSVPWGDVTHAQFVAIFAAPLAGVPSLSAALQAKWQWYHAMLSETDVVTMSLPIMQGIVGEFVTDLLATQQEIDAAKSRAACRAEVLWGAGSSPTWQDIARVRNVNGRAS
jgi:hypothetical protein